MRDGQCLQRSNGRWHVAGSLTSSAAHVVARIVTGYVEVESSASAAWARLLVVLASMSSTPRLQAMAERATAEPRLEELVVAGLPTTLARPHRARPCATLVFIPGATA